MAELLLFAAVMVAAAEVGAVAEAALAAAAVAAATTALLVFLFEECVFFRSLVDLRPPEDDEFATSVVMAETLTLGTM